MILQPIIKNNICLNAHPLGLRRLVDSYIRFVKSRPPIKNIKAALILGASTGYGLASRVTASFGAGAATVGVSYGRPPTSKRTGNVGFYTTRAFETAAAEEGLLAKSFFGDAFSREMKDECAAFLKESGMKLDLVVYSLASGARLDPETGTVFRGVIKPIGKTFRGLSIDAANAGLKPLELPAAAPDEITATVKVMGGEDWKLWIKALLKHDVLAPGCRTVAYSYIGPALTSAIYREGTLGRAKEHLEATAVELNSLLRLLPGRALVSVNKAIVTRSSAVIPLVPLYISFLYRVMREKRVHEDCIDQVYRLFSAKWSEVGKAETDEAGRIRMDDWELREDVQEAVNALYSRCLSGLDPDCGEAQEYKEEFLRFHGFGWPGVDYEADVDIT